MIWSKEQKLLDDILRQVVCCCGNYRHHGVGWMPKGSGEGLDEALDLVQAYADHIRKEEKQS